MHTRQRHIEKILRKRAKIFPVLGVLGPRQVGKSTFLMQQWCELKNANYITLDKKEIVTRASRAPEQLLMGESDNQHKHLIIDEAQKVPHLFDSIKALVDENRRVGAFTLSGSVEFSLKTGVRESLAGRMGITRLYPMTLRELGNLDFVAPWVDDQFTAKKPLMPKAVETWLTRGGMPVFCRLSDTDERISSINSWLEAICYRDLKQFKDAVYDSELAYNLMTTLAMNAEAPLIKLAAEFGCTAAMIKKHLIALEALFLIYKIPSFENARAQSKYTVFDSGVLQALLNAQQSLYSHHASLISLLINEIYAQYEYAGKLKPKLYYYKARGGAEIDLVLKTRDKLCGIECTTSVEITPYQQRGMKSFLQKYEQAMGYFVAPVQKRYQLDKKMWVVPWNEIG